MDAAHVAKCLRDVFGIRVVATACDEFEGLVCTPGADGALAPSYAHLEGGGCLVYATTWKEDVAGVDQPEFGGYHQPSRRPVGASAVWLDEALRPHLRYLLVMGGGTVAMQNVDLCLFGGGGGGGGGGSSSSSSAGGTATAAAPAPPSSRGQGKGSSLPVIYLPCKALHCGAGREPGSWLGRINDFIRIRPQMHALMTADSRRRMMHPDPWFEFRPASEARR